MEMPLFWLTFDLSKDPIKNKSLLVHIMAWRLIGDRLLSEPMMNQFHWHIYASPWPQSLTNHRIYRGLMLFCTQYQWLVTALGFVWQLHVWQICEIWTHNENIGFIQFHSLIDNEHHSDSSTVISLSWVLFQTLTSCWRRLIAQLAIVLEYFLSQITRRQR